jgi:hypothetical protein
MRTRVCSMRTRVYSIRTRVYSMRARVYSMRTRVYSIQTRVYSMRARVYSTRGSRRDHFQGEQSGGGICDATKRLCQPIGSWIRSASGAVSGEPRTRQDRAGTARHLGSATANAQRQSECVVRPRTRNRGGVSAAHAPSPQPAGGATRQQTQPR